MMGYCEIPGCNAAATAYSDDGQALCDRHVAVANIVDTAGAEVMAAVNGCLTALSTAIKTGRSLPGPVLAAYYDLDHAHKAYLQAVNVMACIELAA